MFKITLLAAALAVGLVSIAQAQGFRPGSSPAGGRIGKICNDEHLDVAERTHCFESMKAAKNGTERNEIRDAVRAKLKDKQKAIDEARRIQGATGPNQ